MPGPEPPPYLNRVELLQGTLDMLILQTLQWGAQHGYGIAQALRAQSGGKQFGKIAVNFAR